MKAMHRSQRLLAVLVAAMLGSAPALAAPPWAGGGNDKGGGKHEHQAKGGKDHKGGGKEKGARGGKPQVGAYFSTSDRRSVETYYASAGRGGKGCPPGLAKKNNGCMPPGQAKKWNVGQPLPSGVAYYPVPAQIVVSLPPVPIGHKYVQVAGDILLVAVGSMMVIDGINGLTR